MIHVKINDLSNYKIVGCLLNLKVCARVFILRLAK